MYIISYFLSRETLRLFISFNYAFVSILPLYVNECRLSLIYLPLFTPISLPHKHITLSPLRIVKSSTILSFQQCHNLPFPTFTYLKSFFLHFEHLIVNIFPRLGSALLSPNLLYHYLSHCNFLKIMIVDKLLLQWFWIHL